MKKQLLSLVAVFFFVVSVNANGGEKKSVNLKSTNYKEIISKIKYPKICREKGIEGKVFVTLKVDKKGKIISHEFISYPCSDLRDAVESILPELVFAPAKNGKGEAIDGEIVMPVNFQLTI